MKINVALIGYGYWGPNLLRNLVSHSGCKVQALVDGSEDARTKSEARFPHVPTFESLEDFLHETKPDTEGKTPWALVIATPPKTHAALAIKGFNHGFHCLIEKPLALSHKESLQVLEAAKKAKKKLMVDHTFVFNPAVEHLGKRIHKNELGDLLYYDSVRINLGGFQPGANVLWDLAPHDLSILDYFTGGAVPETVTATGIKHFGSHVENLCYVSLKYAHDFVAHLHLNWTAPVKVRTVMVGGTKKMAIYDDNLTSEKIKIYDKGLSLTPTDQARDFRVNYRVGDMTAPALSTKEALYGMIDHFLTCIKKDRAPISDGFAGARVVQILEAASKSMAQSGKPIKIEKTKLLKHESA